MLKRETTEDTSKESGPRGPDFSLPVEGFNCLSPLRQSAGVMELWSNGVMKGLIHIEIRAYAFSNSPTLQYSKTPRNLYRQSH